LLVATMGNNANAMSEEQNQAASAEALAIFQILGLDVDKGLALADWEAAFDALDADQNGSVSRKEWYLKQGTTSMYDAVQKKHPGSIARAEWVKAFEILDVDQDGKITVDEWLRRRLVQLSFYPLGMGAYSWGVAVGEDCYEIASLNRSATEMAVVGPQGIVALGEWAKEEGGKEAWLNAMHEAVEDGTKHSTIWFDEKSEPRARPADVWESFEHAGWSMRNDEQIQAWVEQWVEQNPTYKAIDPLGRECNEQTFALAFISWLIGSEYSRMTDNTKGRAIVYGGLALLAIGAGAAAISYANKKPAQELEKPKEEK